MALGWGKLRIVQRAGLNAHPVFVDRTEKQGGTTVAAKAPFDEPGDNDFCPNRQIFSYLETRVTTAEDFTEDDYFNTGDKGLIDEDGYVSIVGRAKDVVITGGLNVYPKEVELFIDDLPGVKESAVIGVPHADFGEAVVAVVVPGKDSDLSEAQIVDACKLELANFKVQKNVMRDQLRDKLPASPMKMTTTACTS